MFITGEEHIFAGDKHIWLWRQVLFKAHVHYILHVFIWYVYAEAFFVGLNSFQVDQTNRENDS